MEPGLLIACIGRAFQEKINDSPRGATRRQSAERGLSLSKKREEMLAFVLSVAVEAPSTHLTEQPESGDWRGPTAHEERKDCASPRIAHRNAFAFAQRAELMAINLRKTSEVRTMLRAAKRNRGGGDFFWGVPKVRRRGHHLVGCGVGQGMAVSPDKVRAKEKGTGFISKPP